MAEKKELLCRLVTVHTFESPGDYGVPLKAGEDALYFDADGNFVAVNDGLLNVPIRESEIRLDQVRDAKFPIHVLIVRAEYAPGETDTQATNYKLVLDTGNPPKA